MPSRCAILLAIITLTGLPGCRFFEKLSKERTPADPASRSKDKDKDWLRDRQDREFDPAAPPKDWLSGPATAGRGNRVPPAAENDNGNRSVDASTASRRSVSGILEDADGRPVPNTYITVENADPAKAGSGAPMGVETDTTGFFEIRGLKANEDYMLSATMSRNGQSQAGRTQVRVPRSGVRLQLREDYQLPNRGGNTRNTTADTASDLPPGGPSPNNSPNNPNERPAPIIPAAPPLNNQEWSPLGPGSNPEATRPSITPRSDLIADGPQPGLRSSMPPVNIPGPTAPPVTSPLVPTVPQVPIVPGPTSNAVPRESRFGLLTGSGKLRTFPSGQANDLVLLDFMTTTCLPCKKAIPTLAALNEKYSGRGVELIAVCCDATSEAKRVTLANKYRDDNKLQYAVYAEAASGNAIQDRFGVESYPTLVLIDGNGKRLWKGHPQDKSELERILRDRLANR